MMSTRFPRAQWCLTLSLSRDSLNGRDVRAMGAVAGATGFGRVESAIVSE